MSRLRVSVSADGARRHFIGHGDGPELVAAFREWIASADFWFPMCTGADDLERAAAAIQPTPGVTTPKQTHRRGREEPELVTVWSGALEARGDAPGLSSPLIESTLAKAVQELAEDPTR